MGIKNIALVELSFKYCLLASFLAFGQQISLLQHHAISGNVWPPSITNNPLLYTHGLELLGAA